MPDNLGICDRFLHLAKYFYGYYAQKPDLSKIMLREMFFLASDKRDSIKGPALEFVRFVSEMLEQARKEGQIRDDVDLGLAAMSFFSHYLNVLFFGLSESRFDPDASLLILRQLLNQLMKGIGLVE